MATPASSSRPASSFSTPAVSAGSKSSASVTAAPGATRMGSMSLASSCRVASSMVVPEYPLRGLLDRSVEALEEGQDEVHRAFEIVEMHTADRGGDVARWRRDTARQHAGAAEGDAPCIGGAAQKHFTLVGHTRVGGRPLEPGGAPPAGPRAPAGRA